MSTPVQGQPFHAIKVCYDGLGQTVISWTLDTRFDDPYPHMFELEYANSIPAFATGEYTVLTTARDAVQLKDVVFRAAGLANFAYYRVALTTPAGKYLSPIKGLTGNVVPTNVALLRELLRKERLALRADRGAVAGYLFKRRYYGPSCSCVEKNTGALITTACLSCAGTGFKYGYFPGIEFPILIAGPETRKAQSSPQGISDIHVIQGRCLAAPFAEAKDVWMEQDTSRIYEVAGGAIVGRLGMEPIAANVELRELPLADTVALLIASLAVNDTPLIHFNPLSSS